MSDIKIIAQSVASQEPIHEPISSDDEIDMETMNEVVTHDEEENDTIEQEKNNSEDEVLEEDPKPKKQTKPKETKPKGKYDDMTFKELQALTKERNVSGRSVLKNRTLIIQKLEELDQQPEKSSDDASNTNKYDSMTIPELKKLMTERNISGRSATKNKPAMIEKLMAFDSNPEESTKKESKKAPKEKVITEDKEEDPVDKKVAELVNKIYQIKKYAKKQEPEFKNGFVDYINDLGKLVEDYQNSFKA
jgi:flagellar biosynthesis/type III secretory pathway chaperone